MAPRATSLGPKPSLLFFVFCLFLSFLSLLFMEKSCFRPRKWHFVFIFECLPLFVLSLFWPPPFAISLSLCRSLSLYIYIYMYVYIYMAHDRSAAHIFGPKTVRSPHERLKKGHSLGPKFWTRFFSPLFF